MKAQISPDFLRYLVPRVRVRRRKSYAGTIGLILVLGILGLLALAGLVMSDLGTPLRWQLQTVWQQGADLVAQQQAGAKQIRQNDFAYAQSLPPAYVREHSTAPDPEALAEFLAIPDLSQFANKERNNDKAQ